MRQLRHHLETWVQAGLLTEEQAQRIITHEEEHPRRSWLVFAFGGIGVLVIATGLVSLVAANWDLFSSTLKLAAYFGSLAAAAWGVLRYLEHPGIVRELLLTILMLWLLAGIGLVGQVYNLKGEGSSALFFWLALSLPIVLLAHNRLTNHFWLAGLATAAGIWISEHSISSSQDRLLYSAGIPAILLGIGSSRPNVFSEYFARCSLSWSIAGCAAISIAGNLLWYDASVNTDGLPLLFILTASLLANLASWRKHERGNTLLALALFAIHSMLAILFLLPIFIHAQDQRLLGTFLFIVTWTCAAAAASIAGLRRVFDFCTAVIALRLIVVYFEVFGTLAATGFGLIVSGSVMLIIAYLWHRYRSRAAQLFISRIQGGRA